MGVEIESVGINYDLIYLHAALIQGLLHQVCLIGEILGRSKEADLVGIRSRN